MNELVKWMSALLILLGIYSLLFNLGGQNVTEEQARHWINDCRLLETNIDKGFFSPAQNRIQCGDVIENVSMSDYDSARNGDKQIKTIAELIEEVFSH